MDTQQLGGKLKNAEDIDPEIKSIQDDIKSTGMGRKRNIDENTLDMYGKNLFNRIKDYSLRGCEEDPNCHEDALTYAKNHLVYLMMPYNDFNKETQIGEMIVDKRLADEVLWIFKDLYKSGYPIERMDLVDRYTDRLDNNRKADDWTSIQANNTSAFNYRHSNNGFKDEERFFIS